MSASNWGKCPKCIKIAERTRRDRIEKTADQYGKIAAAEFVRRMNKAEAAIDVGETLREDYEQGIDSEGEYSVGYRASCGKCGFEFLFRHTEDAITKGS
jgi:ribosome-binding protein aMBF1 (putative translation factor)